MEPNILTEVSQFSLLLRSEPSQYICSPLLPESQRSYYTRNRSSSFISCARMANTVTYPRLNTFRPKVISKFSNVRAIAICRRCYLRNPLFVNGLKFLKVSVLRIGYVSVPLSQSSTNIVLGRFDNKHLVDGTVSSVLAG
jgi:hypothetical protein